jgi:hypothetical protein
LIILDVSDPKEPQEITRYGLSLRALGIHIKGKYAYISVFSGNLIDRGVRVVDIYNPEEPKEVGFYDIDAHVLIVDGRLFVSDNHVYACSDAGVYILKYAGAGKDNNPPVAESEEYYSFGHNPIQITLKGRDIDGDELDIIF